MRTLLEGRSFVGAGPAEVTWDGRDDAGRTMGAGVFFYELRAATGVASGRLVMLQ